MAGRFSTSKDHGVSLLEVMISMVILSIVLASVASLVLSSVTTINRSYEGASAASIAQDSLDRLLAAPMHTWAFDSKGRIKRERRSFFAGVGGYRIERKIEPVDNIYEFSDACDTVIGKQTPASDLVKVTVTITPNSQKFTDSYTTSLLISRNEDAAVAESSLTIKFHVGENYKRQQYDENRHGGPIDVTINQGTAKEKTASTKNGCVTFIGIDTLHTPLSFKTKRYTESLSRKSDYREDVHLVKGGNRLVEYDLIPKRVFTVAPHLHGLSDVDCKEPRLMRIRTPLATGPNRAIQPLSLVAQEGAKVAEALARVPENRRTEADRARLEASQRWQYYAVCRDWVDADGRPQDPYAMVLPDTIPISLVERKNGEDIIKPLGTWASAIFDRQPYPLVEEADWPVFEIPETSRTYEQFVMAGSCVMNGSELRGVLVNVNRDAKSHWDSGKPKVLAVPMWPIPIDGIDEAEHYLDEYQHSSVPDLNGTYPLVLKNIYDNGDRRRFGDSLVRSINLQEYSGCEDTPVAHVGWLKTYDYQHDRNQMRLLMPFGLYTYSFYMMNEVEQNETGNTVPKSRHSCTSSCANAFGEKGCIRSGASDLLLFRANGHNLVRAIENGGYDFFDTYVDWKHRHLDPVSTGQTYRHLAPRGPVVEACVAD